MLALALLLAAEQPVLNYIPKHEDLTYTFGGAAPKLHIKSGTRIVSWSEDCYDGAVTRPDQLPTKVEPARDHGISSFFPGFGALNATDRTAVLGPDLPERVWFYQVDREKGVART